ncbi:lysozyme [Pseudorhodobacter sp. E13]|uniref:glycoside hydrolase family protein n=1 Tax=Pseudorhodobacter sp. E13 TaxID=2487931 RepID=UPI000F8F0D23|nr:peptidoglycan-binding protein [Pseudorhodobacter sp. E13]RUS64889.1 lysozyme [Pseudorhodobacter sp. E13]
MQTSAQGEEGLIHEEGEVLRAYRCPAGVWTIGVGLTAASGVVKPKAGMVISKAESRSLLQKALRRNYEPAVSRAMPSAKQHEFDAGVGFHFNTGAIGKATWVKSWREKARRAVITERLIAWNKGGGKVLPGLVHRRARECDMLFDAKYPVPPPKPVSSAAIWAIHATNGDKAAAQEGFRRLGYLAGPHSGVIPIEMVSAFQRDHGLTVDGIIGRATLSTLQRMLDARAKAIPAAAAPTVAGTATASGADQALTSLPYVGEIALGLGLIFALYVAFSYRDAIAAAVHHRFPNLAAKLRSF